MEFIAIVLPHFLAILQDCQKRNRDPNQAGPFIRRLAMAKAVRQSGVPRGERREVVDELDDAVAAMSTSERAAAVQEILAGQVPTCCAGWGDQPAAA